MEWVLVWVDGLVGEVWGCLFVFGDCGMVFFMLCVNGFVW